MKKVVSFLLFAVVLFMATSCSPWTSGTTGGDKTSKEPMTVVVHYYDEKTKAYTALASDKTLATNYIAPAGQVIKGLFDESGVQYAGYDCVIDLKNNPQLPSDLYAEYEDVDISYLEDSPIIVNDEDPVKISFYSTDTTKFSVTATDPDDQRFIAACLCNPYADLIFTVTFYGKGFGNDHSNDFYSKLLIGEDVVGSYTTEDFDSEISYTKYTYMCRIKAKQLSNADHQFILKMSARYGYEDYTVKNCRIDIAFDFND